MENKEEKEKRPVQTIAELRAALEKELTALLEHPLVPEEFRKVFITES